MKRKKKIIILSCMIGLLVLTGYINVALNSNLSQESVNTSGELTSSNFYTAYREERENTRTEEIAFYEAIINSESASASAKLEAENNKLAIIEQMEQELIVEAIIKGKGYEDVVITTSSSNVNVFVKSQELTKQEVAQISSVVTEQLKVDIEKVIVIPSI